MCPHVRLYALVLKTLLPLLNLFESKSYVCFVEQLSFISWSLLPFLLTCDTCATHVHQVFNTFVRVSVIFALSYAFYLRWLLGCSQALTLILMFYVCVCALHALIFYQQKRMYRVWEPGPIVRPHVWCTDLRIAGSILLVLCCIMMLVTRLA